MPLQGSQQPQNPHIPASTTPNYGKNVGAQTPQAIQWEIDHTPNTGFNSARVQALQTQLADVNYTNDNRNTYNELVESGYNPASPYTSKKNWGAYGTLGGIGEAEAQKEYQKLLAYGKESGDWSPMENFQSAAEGGNRKYHRNGLFGTGIDLMPHSPLSALGMFAGAAAGLGAFKGFGIPGIAPGSGVPNLAPVIDKGTQLSNGLSASGNAFSGISGYNAASPFAQTLSTGSNLGSMAGLGATGNLVGDAAIGLSQSSAPSSLLSLQNAQKVAKLASSFMGGGGQEGQTPQQAQQQAQQRIPTISQASPNFRSGVQDRLNLNTNVKTKERKPFMTVQEMFNQRYG